MQEIKQNPEPGFCAVTQCPKMGKCCEMKHFPDLGGISPKNPQPNNLMVLGNKKSVSAVSPVPTVSFHCADNGCLDFFRLHGCWQEDEGKAERLA